MYFCDVRSDNKSCVEHHIEKTHRELQCQYCNFKVISISNMNTHIHSAHDFIQTTASANSLSRPPAANLPVFVPGTTYSREEYTRCFFLLVLPKYSKYKIPWKSLKLRVNTGNVSCDPVLGQFRRRGQLKKMPRNCPGNATPPPPCKTFGNSTY